MPTADRTAPSDTVDPHEVERFSALAATWWDPQGPMRPLHRMNPTRVAFVRDHAARRFGRAPEAPRPLDGLGVLDIGCGAGLLAEPMTRLGARVTGLDAAEEALAVARAHAAEMDLAIDYRSETAEALADTGTAFDVVLAMEVVEHVADVDRFLEACCRLVAPGGLLVLSTISRTARSLLLAKIGAEYVLRWLPRGTHDWRRFLRPSEVVRRLESGGLKPVEIAGMSWSPLTDGWVLTRDPRVNYILAAARQRPSAYRSSR
jgi:2-polyprenyl-6-hydroxyphenyl methylase / 3-demethylubiquinone-9 3-methyltransferase